jgi:hypothetical protein
MLAVAALFFSPVRKFSTLSARVNEVPPLSWRLSILV